MGSIIAAVATANTPFINFSGRACFINTCDNKQEQQHNQQCGVLSTRAQANCRGRKCQRAAGTRVPVPITHTNTPGCGTPACPFLHTGCCTLNTFCMHLFCCTPTLGVHCIAWRDQKSHSPIQCTPSVRVQQNQCMQQVCRSARHETPCDTLTGCTQPCSALTASPRPRILHSPPRTLHPVGLPYCNPSHCTHSPPSHARTTHTAPPLARTTHIALAPSPEPSLLHSAPPGDPPARTLHTALTLPPPHVPGPPTRHFLPC